MGGHSDARVLVVDDDQTVADVVLTYLTRAGMRADHVIDGVTAVASFQGATDAGEPYDLVVLDLMLPGMNGLDVYRRMKLIEASLVDPKRSATPVVMLTARGEEEDRVAGLELGADDYITKPFSPRELVLRVQSVLRRSSPQHSEGRATDLQSTVLSDSDIEIDTAAHSVRLAGRVLCLTSREFDLLAFFIENPGQAFSREDLMRNVWQWEYGDYSTVTVHVRRLREKLEVEPSQPRRLVTVWGVGYRWDPQPALTPAMPR